MEKPKAEEFLSLLMDHFIADIFNKIVLNVQMDTIRLNPLNILELLNKTCFITRERKRVNHIHLTDSMREDIELRGSYPGFHKGEIMFMKDHLIKIMNFTERALLSSQLDHTKVVS
jgi:hypothetical protein